jgi:hypothetical protein
LAVGALIFGRSDCRLLSGAISEEAVWLIGPDAVPSYRTLEARAPDSTTKGFVESGFFVTRSGWDNDSNWLLLDCGPHGAMNCGHAHADALSLEIAVRGESLVTDSGTFSYPAIDDNRNRYRSTGMHSTLSIDGESSSIPSGPFKWAHKARCDTRCWQQGPGFSYLEGTHDGYQRFPDPATHRRAVLYLVREYWIILDSVESRASHACSVGYQLAPGADACIDELRKSISITGRRGVLDISYPFGEGDWRLTKSHVSRNYGLTTPVTRAEYNFDSREDSGVLGVIFPRDSYQEPAVVSGIYSDDGRSLSVDVGRYSDTVLWQVSEASPIGVDSADFDWVWIRRSKDSLQLEQIVMLHGSKLVLGDLSLQFETAVASCVVTLTGGKARIDVGSRANLAGMLPGNFSGIFINGRELRPRSDGRFECESDVDFSSEELGKTNNRCSYVRH